MRGTLGHWCLEPLVSAMQERSLDAARTPSCHIRPARGSHGAAGARSAGVPAPGQLGQDIVCSCGTWNMWAWNSGIGIHSAAGTGTRLLESLGVVPRTWPGMCRLPRRSTPTTKAYCVSGPHGWP